MNTDGLWGASLLVAYVAILGLGTGRLCGPHTDVPPVARVLARVVYGVAATIALALLLGTVRLGTAPAALLVAATVLLLLARRLPRPSGAEVSTDRAGTSPWLGILVGIACGAIVWNAARPWLGRDGLGYHLPEALHWVHAGNPGATVRVNAGVPFGSYPLVDEIAHSALLGLSGSFVPSTVWPVAMWLLLGGAVWALLDGLGAGAPARVLTVAVVLSSPLLLVQLGGPNNDLSAVAWLTAGAALLVRSQASLALAPPAALALALAVGTKTTSLPFALVGAALLVRTVVRARGWAGLATRAAASTTAVSALLGGLWAARNLHTHGAPFWPTSRFPFGPELSPSQQAVSDTFFDRPGQTLEGRGERFREALGGLGAGTGIFLLLSLALRRRRLLGLAALVVVGLVVWAASPSTGVSDDPFYARAIVGTVRYLLPPLVAGVCGLGLVTTVGRRWATVTASLALLVCLVINVWLALDIGVPTLPDPSYRMTGALAGGTIGVLAGLRRPPAGRMGAPTVLATACAAVAVVATVCATDGFVARHIEAYERAPGTLRWVEAHAAGVDSTVLMWPSTNAMFAGDHLERPIELLPVVESCDQLLRRLEHELLVIGPGVQALPGHLRGCLLAARPLFNDGIGAVYGPAALRTDATAESGS